MGNITTAAILLRYANYKDYDRMITLFSPQYGKMDVLARGCRRPKSPFLNACELFSTGEYVLYQAKDRFILTNATIHETFHPLRLDYATLTQGSYLLDLTQAALEPLAPAPALFRLLIKTLHPLAYGQVDGKALLSLFLFHYVGLLGYRPSLNQCVCCEKPLGENDRLFFDYQNGGIVCENCSRQKKSSFLSKELYQWLLQAGKTGPQDVDGLLGDPPFELLQRYAETRLDFPIKSSTSLIF